MTFTAFTAHFAANQNKIAASVAAQIKREARARIIERQQAGRADSALDFSDLIHRIETAVAGA